MVPILALKNYDNLGGTEPFWNHNWTLPPIKGQNVSKSPDRMTCFDKKTTIGIVLTKQSARNNFIQQFFGFRSTNCFFWILEAWCNIVPVSPSATLEVLSEHQLPSLPAPWLWHGNVFARAPPAGQEQSGYLVTVNRGG